jgi:hypothetical protein
VLREPQQGQRINAAGTTEIKASAAAREWGQVLSEHVVILRRLPMLGPASARDRDRCWHLVPFVSTLTDNGMVFTTRLSGGRGGRNAFEHELRRLHVDCLVEDVA